MKIMQLNTWGGRLQQQVINLIEKEDPDIVCLQESISVPTGDAVFFGTLEDILDVFPKYNKFFSPAFSFRLMQRQAESGRVRQSPATAF